MDKQYCVYLHTNDYNGKVYVGITSQVPHRRWNNGKGYINNKYFYRSIEKYGWHNFSHKILYTDLSKEEAEQLEIKLIKEYNSANPEYGYNIELGGNSTEKFTYETKAKISKALQGHICTEETKEKIRRAKIGKTYRAGYKMSKEAIEKNRKAHLGQPAWNKGRPWSEEERANIGKAVLCVELGIIYPTARDAGRKLGIDPSSIAKCRRGKKKTAGGYHWEEAKNG